MLNSKSELARENHCGSDQVLLVDPLEVDSCCITVEFWSSVQYLSFMDGLTKNLKTMGYNAQHRFYISYADYRAATSLLRKVWLRVRMYVIYPMRLAVHCFFSSGNTILVICTNTFYAPLIASLLAKRNSAVVHLVYDLYPDVLVQAGALNGKSWIISLLNCLTNATFKRTSANVFLGKHLLDHALTRFEYIQKPKVIAVGADGELFLQAIPRLNTFDEAIRILYCGNLGKMHDIETVCALFVDPTWFPPRRLHFDFHANGSGFLTLKSVLGGCLPKHNVDLRFGSVLAEEQWVQVMIASHVALVCMKKGAEKVIMPSKTYSALMSGQAILAVCAPESDLASLVRQHDCGWVVTPADVDGMKKAIAEISGDEELLLRRRRNAFNAGHSFYASQHLAKQWIALFSDLGRTIA